jgi:hypothetical protein
MRRKILRQASGTLLALLSSAGAPVQSAAQSFSADIVRVDSGGARAKPAKLHAANLKTRIEVPDAADGFFISDIEAATALYVRSAQRIYLDARQSTPLTQIFVWVDPHDPCRQWQAAANTAGMPRTAAWRCESIGSTTVNQREVVEYRVSVPGRPSSYGWVDRALGFPLKWQSADGPSFLVENLLFQSQPATLFDIPPDYRKLDPQALIERIKHSDVWADPAK